MRLPKPNFSAALLLAFVLAKPAYPQFGFGLGATEFTQILNHAQLAMNYIKEAQTALNAIQMAQMMVREGVNLAEHPSTNVMTDMMMLSNILQSSQGLAGDMARMDAQFRQAYGNYNGPDATTDYALKYSNWANTTLNTIHGSLNAAGYQGSMIQNEQQWLSRMQLLNSSPQGRNESLQIGNTIGLELVGQLQKLRQLMISDMSTKAAFSAQQVTAGQTQQNATQRFFSAGQVTSDHQGFWPGTH